MRKYKVVLFFRRRREAANYSIEGSFDIMTRAFPDGVGFQLEKYTLSHLSNGLLPRIRGVLEARANQGDVNHVTGDVHYLVLGLPSNRTVLTIHDCGFIYRKNPFIRRLLKWIWLDLPVRHCRFVTAVSEATKQDIVRFSRCNPSKVHVIPTIVESFYRPSPKEFDTNCPRILHIGLAPNKNFERHIEALEGINCHLHIVGRLSPYHIGLLSNRQISYTNEYNISPSDMLKAYVQADVVLFASTFEGFGMPIIEGQSVGRVVVTSRVSSMPEVAGEGACLVDPYDVDSIRRGLRRVIDDTDYRQSLISAGFDNVKRFAPESVARQYENLYREVVAFGNPSPG